VAGEFKQKEKFERLDSGEQQSLEFKHKYESSIVSVHIHVGSLKMWGIVPSWRERSFVSQGCF
jgi:hypothetical protein